MSGFSEINKLVCLPVEPPDAEKLDLCPVEEEIPKEIWYDAEKRRYYVYQREALNGKFLPSILYNETSEALVLPIMKEAGKDRIINHFSIDVPLEEKILVEVNLEESKVYDKPDKPVRFLLYINEDEFSNEKATASVSVRRSEEEIRIDGKIFFNLMETLLKKLNLYAKYQSVLYSFDKIKILKENGQPFYLSLVADRLKKFTSKFRDFLIDNNTNLKNLGDIVFVVETIGPVKRIIDVYVDSSKVKCQDNPLSVGLEEFLKSPFLEDNDLVSFILSAEEILKDTNISWIDLIIRYGSGLKLENFFSNMTASIPCFPDFNLSFDAILDKAMTFFEKLEYSSHKKNSFALADVFETPGIFKFPSDFQGPNFDGFLDPIFEAARSFNPDINLDFDNPFTMFTEAAENFSFEGPDFDNVYQFLGPEAFSKLLNKLLSVFQKMSNPLDIQEAAIKNFLESLKPKSFIKLVERLTSQGKFNYLNKLKDKLTNAVEFLGYDKFIELLSKIELIHRLNYLNIIKTTFDIKEGLEVLNVEYPNLLKKYDFKVCKSIFKRFFSNIPLLNPEDYNITESGLFIETKEKIVDVANYFPEDAKLYFYELVQAVFGIKDYIGFMGKAQLLDVLKNYDFSTLKRVFMSMFISTEEEAIDVQEYPFIDITNIFDYFPDFPRFNEIDVLDFSQNFDQLVVYFDFSDITEFFKQFLRDNPEEDPFTGIAEFDKMSQLYDVFSFPGANFLDATEFLENVAGKINIFTEKYLKIPNIPNFPPIKFSILKLIQENLTFIIKKAVTKLAALVIQKIVGLIKTATEAASDGLANNLATGNVNGFSASDGLQKFVNQFLCKEDDEQLEPNISNENIDSADATDGMLKNLIPAPDISDQSFKDLADTIGRNSNILDIIDAVVQEKNDKNKKFFEDLTEIVRVNNPEFKSYFKDAGDTEVLFTSVKNFMSPSTLQSVRAFADDIREEPEIGSDYCITKEKQQIWSELKEQELLERGYDKEAAKKYVDDKAKEIANSTEDIVDLMTGSKVLDSLQDTGLTSFQDRLFDSIEDILKGDPACLAPEDVQDVISEQKEKEEKTSDLMLEKINQIFTEDLLEDGPLSVFNGKGMLSRVMSDKFGRSMSVVKALKTNFITALLMRLGILPGPDFPNTIGKSLTEKLQTGFLYSPTTSAFTFKAATQKSLSSFLPDIVFSQPAEVYKSSDLTLTKPVEDGVNVKYIDYNLDDEFRYLINVADDFVLNSKTRIPKQIIKKYPNITSLPKKDFINLLLTTETYNSWNSDNQVIFNPVIANSLGFESQIEFGYPAEVTKEHLDLLQEAYKNSGVTGEDAIQIAKAAVNDPSSFPEHINVLDPETYGTILGKARLYANPTEIPEGFFKDSSDFYDKKVDDKLDKTILNLSSIKKFKDNYKQVLENNSDKFKYLETSPECLLDRPADKVVPIEKLTNAQSMVKTYIRTYLSEYIILANNIFKESAFDLDKTAFASYILEKIKFEVKESKKPQKDIYNAYVTYIMMLMSNAEAYMHLNSDNLSNDIQQMNDLYTPLQKSQIKFLKTHQVSRLDNEYENYVLGYYGISFRENHKLIYDGSGIYTIKSNEMTSNDIKFADKFGHALKNIDILEEAMLRTIEGEIEEYHEIYKPQYKKEKTIYTEFLKNLTGQENLFPLGGTIPTGWSTESRYIITKRTGSRKFQTKPVTKSGLLEELNNLTDIEKTKYVSDIFGNARKIGTTYIGTIGIMYEVSVTFKGEKVCTFSEDIPDVFINNLISDLEENSNYSSLIIDHVCFVDNLMKTDEAKIVFDLAFQVKKLPTLMAIYYMENLIPSIVQHPDEQPSGVFGALDSLFDDIGDGIPFEFFLGRTFNLSETKKEIKEMFLGNYIREFFDPPRQDQSNFLDFKIRQSILEAVDYKNLAIGGGIPLLPNPFGNAPSFLQQISFLDDLSLDENGMPAMNKFLKNFKENQ